MSMLRNKDLLGIQQLSAEEIQLILDTAKTMKYILLQNSKKVPHLSGKSITTLFFENSTRTRLSFELASKYMSAASANVAVASSSVQKGESLLDTAVTIDQMGTDILIVRHSMSGAPHLIAKHIKASVINAWDGVNEHPTQALLDALTMVEHKGKLEGLKVAIVGDIRHSRVARSNIFLLNKMGASVSVGGPSTLIPKYMEQMNVSVFESVQEALLDADVVMGLRIQNERISSNMFPSVREYSRFFGIDQKRLEFAKPDALLLHPGPVNRGVELSSGVVDSDQSLINEQVTNGVAVRMAVMYLLSRKG